MATECPKCNVVEKVEHVILRCDKYDLERKILRDKIKKNALFFLYIFCFFDCLCFSIIIHIILIYECNLKFTKPVVTYSGTVGGAMHRKTLVCDPHTQEKKKKNFRVVSLACSC